MHRTTIELEETLYRLARKTAIDRDKPFKELVGEALQQYLLRLGVETPKRKPDPMPGVYPSQVTGTLSRRDIYADLK